MTAVDTELDLIQALDFDPSLACEMNEGCEHEARWYAVNACCNHTFTSCEPCRLGMIKWLERKRQIVCLACHRLTYTDPCRIRFEPIKGKP